MAKPTQETPLQAAMREAGVETQAELQKVQAAKRSGEMPAPAAPPPEVETVAAVSVATEVKRGHTPITEDGGPLAEAARAAGVSSVEELQALQAALRTGAAPSVPAVLAVSPTSKVALDEMESEIVRLQDEEATLTGKISRASARVQEIRNQIDSLRAKHHAATYVPNTVANQEYLEASKRAMEERFNSARNAQAAIRALEDPNLNINSGTLDLVKSPLDRAIAAEQIAKRRAESRAALQATAQKK